MDEQNLKSANYVYLPKQRGMSRVRIELPNPFIFSVELEIRITDINYGNHLGNDRVLTLAHEARLHWLRSLGFRDELDFPEGVGTIIADAAIMFLGEGFYGDILEIHIGLESIHSRGFDLIYSMVRKNDQKEIARVKTGILFFNYEERRVAIIPEKLYNKLPVRP